MTISTAVPITWGDQQEFINNGTLPGWFNDGWLTNYVRAGVLDLKAPDELYPGSHMLWTPSPSIPKGAIIISATFAGAAGVTDSGTLDTSIEVISKDGRWNAGLLAAHWTAGIPGGTYPVHVEMRVFDGVTLLAETGAVNPQITDQSWPCRQWGTESPPTARGQKIGQVLTITTGGTLKSASIRGHKVGAPNNNCWLEVYSVSGGLPATLLATSDTRTAASWSTWGMPDVLEVFTFSGGNQITQTLGVQYAYVLTGDWTVSTTNYLEVRISSIATLGTTKFPVVYGESRGLDWGNYVGGADILPLAVIAGSPSVAWAPPNFTAGTVYTSPSIRTLIQAWVNAPAYVQGESTLIRWKPTNPAQLFQRALKSWVHPDTPGSSQEITLTINWRRRRLSVI